MFVLGQTSETKCTINPRYTISLYKIWFVLGLNCKYLFVKSDCTRHKWASFWENRYSGFPTRADTNRALQPLKMAKDLKFWIGGIVLSMWRKERHWSAAQLICAFVFAHAKIRFLQNEAQIVLKLRFDPWLSSLLSHRDLSRDVRKPGFLHMRKQRRRSASR